MIKASELRIGNIYNRKHGKGWTETVITEEIMGKIFSDSKEFALNDFEDIPLTSEWLEKFGCARTFNAPKSDWNIGNINICYDVDDNVYFLYDFDNEIKYVHQLQNLYFALTNTELKLK